MACGCVLARTAHSAAMAPLDQPSSATRSGTIHDCACSQARAASASATRSRSLRIERAEREGLVPVTTEKDLARLAGQDDVAALAAVVQALPVTLKVTEADAFQNWVLT